MKRKLAFALVLVMALSLLAACGGGGAPSANDAAGGDGPKVDAMDVAQNLAEQAVERNAFSLAAAEAFWTQAAGVELNAAAPDWDWTVNEERMATYGDSLDAAYGHASILFEKKDGGEITEEEYKTWAKKVFDATAAASDTGHNIIGWEFVGEGEDALAQVDFERAWSGWMQGWGFLKNGRNMVVYLAEAYDKEKESAIGRLFFYYGVSADIAFGMEKSMDELLGDMEDALEEHGDEIQSVLEGYAS